MTAPTRAVGYIRVSTELQADAHASPTIRSSEPPAEHPSAHRPRASRAGARSGGQESARSHPEPRARRERQRAPSTARMARSGAPGMGAEQEVKVPLGP